MGDVLRLEQFQAQPKWEITVQRISEADVNQLLSRVYLEE